MTLTNLKYNKLNFKKNYNYFLKKYLNIRQLSK